MKLLKYILPFFVLICVSFFSSCEKIYDEDSDCAKGRLILIYAVAANNLQGNLGQDLSEILSVADRLDLENNAVLVYYVINSGECKLKQLKKTNKDSYDYIDIATFPELPLSTSAARMQEVFQYVDTNFDYPQKGLIMWSHATGWLYWPAGSTPKDDRHRAFGQDNYQGGVYKTNIPELAEGIPEGMFDFIWFDCCYSANIETIYELKNKTSHIVGSVIEISAYGMPYQLTMPYLLRKEADLVGAATAFSNYYENYLPYAISIVNTEKLPYLAEVAKEIMTGYEPPFFYDNIQNYAVFKEDGKRATFYDMRQLLGSYRNLPDALKTELSQSFNATVEFNMISNTNWPINGKSEFIEADECSGLSMHNYIDSNDVNAEFYRTLEWYQATH